MVFKQLSIAIRIFIWQIGAKGTGVFLAPDRCIVDIDDRPRRIEVVGIGICSIPRLGRRFCPVGEKHAQNILGDFKADAVGEH